jgi:hypothetical protein
MPYLPVSFDDPNLAQHYMGHMETDFDLRSFMTWYLMEQRLLPPDGAWGLSGSIFGRTVGIERFPNDRSL